MSVVFVAGDQSAEALQPADRALDFPATLVAAEFAPVMAGRFHTIVTMRERADRRYDVRVADAAGRYRRRNRREDARATAEVGAFPAAAQ